MNSTKIDWWAWRSKGSPEGVQAALSAAFDSPAVLRPRRGGYMGYEASAVVALGDMEVGLVAWGGATQKGWTYASVSGQGCAWVQDWDRAQDAADELAGYEARRVDIALDVFDGSSGFDQTLAAYRAGLFCPPGSSPGGRPPKCVTIVGERPEDGRTINVGSRQSGKYFRGYEKGKQMLGPAIAAALASEDGEAGAADHVMQHLMIERDGQAVAVSMWDWWRLELEIKAQGAELPEDLIDRRDQYFAGAYPYLNQVLQDVPAEALVMRRERGPQLDLALALETVRRQYGSTLFTALVAHEGDIGAVWERIVGHKHNQALLRAGVLMVDHE